MYSVIFIRLVISGVSHSWEHGGYALLRGVDRVLHRTPSKLVSNDVQRRCRLDRQDLDLSLFEPIEQFLDIEWALALCCITTTAH